MYPRVHGEDESDADAAARAGATVRDAVLRHLLIVAAAVLVRHVVCRVSMAARRAELLLSLVVKPAFTPCPSRATCT